MKLMAVLLICLHAFSICASEWTLVRMVQWKWKNESADKFRISFENRMDLLPLPYGINTAYGYKSRVEAFWMSKIDLSDCILSAELSKEWQPLPMDGDWRLFWEKGIVIPANGRIRFKSNIDNKNYLIDFAVIYEGDEC